MLKSIFLASALTLAMAGVASAQQQPAPAQPAPSTAAPTINAVHVVDMKELPPQTQAKVNDYVAKQADTDLRKLRSSVDSTPQAKSALQAKGMTSEEVVAASLGNDGTLTLITKKKAS